MADDIHSEIDAQAPVEHSPETPPALPLPRDYPVTKALVWLIIGVYMVTTYPTFMEPSELASMLGVFYPPFIDEGQWWRLITGNLMHASLTHCLNNLFGLFIFGRMLEKGIGSARVALICVISALGCDLFSYWFVPGMSLGASGIVYGLMGAYIAFVLMFRYVQDPQRYQKELRGVFILALVMVVMNLQETNVNSWGHFGGLVGGSLTAVLLFQGFVRDAESIRKAESARKASEEEAG